MNLPMDTARQIAAEYGLTLCDHCEQPREQHFGFDHGKGRCIVADSSIGLMVRFQTHERAVEAMNRINAYNEAHIAAEEAWIAAGDGI